ncbi:hypothetical protein Taro_016717 [Colocasia esculenta]|uniref:D-isomer specific 2-hydroxyacid dehydrogenase catalytic domain-containing protein n=1 Tax=Colocasia esculenta TaxID=4460 RepID=A0A843UTT4_COLES|nr:hypothetical protein [Colocasia esculenta]
MSTLQLALPPDPPVDRRGNQYCSAVVQAIVAPVSTIWSVVRCFNNPQAYKHFIKSCHVLVEDGSSVRTMREVCVVSGLPAATSMERLDEEIHVLSFRIVGGEHRLTNYCSGRPGWGSYRGSQTWSARTTCRPRSSGGRSPSVFEAAKGRLKVVGRAGVGINNVDLQAATEFGCLVVNAPTANTVAAVEHGITLIAAMARNVAQADASMKAGELTVPLPSSRTRFYLSLYLCFALFRVLFASSGDNSSLNEALANICSDLFVSMLFHEKMADDEMCLRIEEENCKWRGSDKVPLSEVCYRFGPEGWEYLRYQPRVSVKLMAEDLSVNIV